MDIKNLCKYIKEMDATVATNNVGSGMVASIDPLIKKNPLKGITNRIKKLRDPINLSKPLINTGPIQLPHNAVSNSLDNGNKSVEQNPLELFNNHDVLTNTRKLMGKVGRRIKPLRDIASR